MSDISVTIGQGETYQVTLGQGILPHALSHAIGGSDTLEEYYYPRSNPSGYAQSGDFATVQYVDDISGSLYSQISFPSNVVFTTGDQAINGAKNFSIRPTVNGTGVLLSGEGGGAVSTGDLVNVFYPLNTNPSGYITGVDLSLYQTVASATGVSGYLQNQINNIDLSNLETATGNLDVRVSAIESVSGDFVLDSNTGAFLTTGAGDSRYYPISSNPSGYITGVDLSDYALSSQTGDFVDKYTTQIITGYKQLNNISINEITLTGSPILIKNSNGDVLGAFYDTLPNSSLLLYSNQNSYALDAIQNGVGSAIHATVNSATGTAYSTHLVRHSQIAMDIDGSIGYDDLIGIYTYMNGAGSVYADADFQEKISIWATDGGKIKFTEADKNSSSYIELRAETPTSGRVITLPDASGKIVLDTQTGSFTGLFYPLSSNPSGYSTFDYVTGVSGYLQGQIDTLNSQTGDYVLTSETGSFLTDESDPIFSASTAYSINSTLTGQWGTSYNDSITGIDVVGTSSKTITLYQRDGSTLTANFADIEGTGGGGNDYFLTGANFNTGNGNLSLFVSNGSSVTGSFDGRYVTGQVIRPSETGNFIAVAPSTSGNVLTSNGTIWTSAPSAGGGSSGGNWVLVSTTTISGTPSTIDFSLAGSYRHYRLEFENVYLSADGYSISVRTSTDGSTFDAGASDYNWSRGFVTSYSPISSTSSAIDIAPLVGSGTDEGLYGWVDIVDPSSTSVKTMLSWRIFNTAYNSVSTNLYEGAGRRNSVGDVTDIRVLSSQTFAGGKIRLFRWSE